MKAGTESTGAAGQAAQSHVSTSSTQVVRPTSPLEHSQDVPIEQSSPEVAPAIETAPLPPSSLEPAAPPLEPSVVEPLSVEPPAPGELLLGPPHATVAIQHHVARTKPGSLPIANNLRVRRSLGFRAALRLSMKMCRPSAHSETVGMEAWPVARPQVRAWRANIWDGGVYVGDLAWVRSASIGVQRRLPRLKALQARAQRTPWSCSPIEAGARVRNAARKPDAPW
jgi:hypothetical protein